MHFSRESDKSVDSPEARDAAGSANVLTTVEVLRASTAHVSNCCLHESSEDLQAKNTCEQGLRMVSRWARLTRSIRLMSGRRSDRSMLSMMLWSCGEELLTASGLRVDVVDACGDSPSSAGC